jgi:TRAP transporter TAXI family solute receptor
MNAKLMITAFLSLSFVWCLILAPNGALAQGKKIIEMESGAFGGYAYQMAYAFGALVNKYCERVAIYNVETPGTSGGVVKVFQDPKNRITNGSSICLYEMLHGMPPFKEAYPEIRIIICYGHMSNPFVTFNPNIRSPEDLVGKRLAIGPAPIALGHNTQNMLEYGHGLKGKVRFINMRWPQMKDALLDGTVDAMLLGVGKRPSPPWSPVAVYQEIQASGRKVYFFGPSKEAVQKTGERDKIPYTSGILPKDALGPGQPAQDTPTWEEANTVVCHKDFDPEITYQMAKISYEHCKDMEKLTAAAKGVWPALIPDIPFPNELIHEGALRFYKEKGLR